MVNHEFKVVRVRAGSLRSEPVADAFLGTEVEFLAVRQMEPGDRLGVDATEREPLLADVQVLARWPWRDRDGRWFQ